MKVSVHQWACCAVTQPWVADPVDTVLAELHGASQHWQSGRLVVRLSEAMLEAVEAAILKASAADNAEQAEETADAATVQGPKLYCLQDFARGKDKNVLEFLDSLPAQYKEKGIDLLAVTKNGGYVWPQIVKRTPDYLTVVLPPGPGKTGKDYAKAVMGKLAQLQSGTAQTVLKFCKDVDDLAQPMLVGI